MSGMGRSGGANGARTRVVVVDDNPDLRALARMTLERCEGVDVVGTAGSGDEALTVTGATDPDVVLLDVVLPDRDGLEVLQSLKADHPDVRVVMMSGLGDVVGEEAIARGASAFISKDHDFVEAIQRSVDRVAEPPDSGTDALRRAAFWAFHCVVGLAGAVALIASIDTAGVPRRPFVFAAFAVAAAVAYRVPISVVIGGRAERTVHLTAQIFVAGLVLLPPAEAVVAMSVGAAVAIVSRRLELARTVMALGLLPLQYAAGAAVASLVPASDGQGLGGAVAAAVAGSAVSVVLNIAMVAVVAMLGNRVPLRRYLATTVPICAAVWLGAAPVGAAGGLLARDHGVAVMLMVVPQLLLLAWSAQHVRLRVEQRRLSVLLEASTSAYSASSVAEAEDVLVRAASVLVDTGAVRIAAQPPPAGIAVRIDDGISRRWLAAEVEDAPEPRRLLEGLAALGSAALQHVARHEEVRYAARHDVSTGLANGALFDDSVARAVALAERDGGAVAVVYIDLDDFKPINDRFGHGAGDIVLRTVASRLRGALRASDLAARLGGDEFAALLPGVGADRDAVARVCEKLRRSLSEPIDVDGVRVVVGASIGAAMWPYDTRDAARLIPAAHAAMYAEKRATKASRR